MNLWIDTQFGAVRGSRYGQQITRIPVKRADTISLVIGYLTDNIQAPLSGSPTGKIILKVENDWTGSAIASATSWTATGAGTAAVYTFSLSLNTVELARLFVDGTISETTAANQTARYALTGLAVGDIIEQTDDTSFWIVVDADELDNAAGWERAPELPLVELIGEVEATAAGAEFTSQTLTFVVHNDVIRGSEGTPTSGSPSYPTPAQSIVARLDITALTGGAATALDGIATAGINLTTDPTLYAVAISGALGLYRLEAGTDAEASPGIIRPDDYHGTTNARVWKQVL